MNQDDRNRDRARGGAATTERGREGTNITERNSAFAFGADPEGEAMGRAGKDTVGTGDLDIARGSIPSGRGTGQGHDDRKSNTAFSTLSGAAAGIGPIPGSSESVSGGSKGAYRPSPGDPGGMGGVRSSAGGDPSSSPGIGNVSGTSSDPLDNEPDSNRRGDRTSGDLGGMGGQRGPGGSSRD